jgi:probable HAF family extracellular repeat protein
MAFRTRLFHFAVALVSAGMLASSADAAPGDIYNLGTLGGFGTTSFGRGISNSGLVTGGSGHAFLYTGTPGAGAAMVDLGTLGGQFGSGAAVNDAGQVAGTSDTTGAPFHAFLYTGTPGSGGAMADLGTLGGNYSDGYAINSAGQVAGTAATIGGEHAFRYSGTPGAGGAMVDLGTLGGTNSSGHGINDAGQVAGYAQTASGASRAFRYTGTPGAGGAMVDLGTLGGTQSAGYDVNNAGQVTGSAYTAGDVAYHAFRYTGTPGAGGTMVDLGTLGGPNSWGWAINDAGFVLGFADRSADPAGAFWPTLWLTDAANTAIDLDAWIDVANPTLGAYWTLSSGSVRGINNHGLITGWGDYNDGPGGLSDGKRAFLLDASSLIPEPAGLALLSVGASSVLRRQRRRRAPPPRRPSSLIDTRVIYCGDCLEQLRKLPDRCVDLIYIDPPFGSGSNRSTACRTPLNSGSCGTRNGAGGALTCQRPTRPARLAATATREEKLDLVELVNDLFEHRWRLRKTLDDPHGRPHSCRR